MKKAALNICRSKDYSYLMILFQPHDLLKCVLVGCMKCWPTKCVTVNHSVCIKSNYQLKANVLSLCLHCQEAFT